MPTAEQLEILKLPVFHKNVVRTVDRNRFREDSAYKHELDRIIKIIIDSNDWLRIMNEYRAEQKIKEERENKATPSEIVEQVRDIIAPKKARKARVKKEKVVELLEQVKDIVAPITVVKRKRPVVAPKVIKDQVVELLEQVKDIVVPSASTVVKRKRPVVAPKVIKDQVVELLEQVKDIVVPSASTVVKRRRPCVAPKVPKEKKEKVAKVPKVKKEKVAKVPRVKKEKVPKVPRVKKEKVLKVPKVPMLKLTAPSTPVPTVFLPPMNIDKKELDVPIKNKVLKPRAKKEESFLSKLAPQAPKLMQAEIGVRGKTVPVKRVLDEVYTGKGKSGFTLVDGKTLLKEGTKLREFIKADLIKK